MHVTLYFSADLEDQAVQRLQEIAIKYRLTQFASLHLYIQGLL